MQVKILKSGKMIFVHELLMELISAEIFFVGILFAGNTCIYL